MAEIKKNIEKLCIEQGIKLTEQRKVIAVVIENSEDHPNAEEIFARASQIDRNISLATVYRTVNLFEGYGIIEKLDFQDGKARYEAKSDLSNAHHHHLIDLETGKVLEFYDEELEKIKEKIASKLGYKLVDHRLELYGIKIKP